MFPQTPDSIFPYVIFTLSAWSACIVIMPYAMVRRKHDLFAVGLVSFLYLSMPIMHMLFSSNAWW